MIAGDRVREERDLALAKVEELERRLNALTNALNSGDNADVAVPFNLETLRTSTPDDWTSTSVSNTRTKSKATVV